MTAQLAVAEKATYLNGLNVQAAVDTIAALKADKSLAKFQFRARNTWINGGENRSVIRDFYGAGQEDPSRAKPFVFTNGEPPVLLGHNEGANPVEFLLHALAGCVTTTFVLHAMALGIDRRTAAEFSFFLALPTLVGATALQLFKHRHELVAHDMGLIAIGAVVSFLVALFVIKAFMAVVPRRGFAPFAWDRVVAGAAALIWLMQK